MIGFRVDANEVIATGHLMRCISIALECKKRGQQCIFFIAEDKETERLRKAGFQYYILNSDWKNLDNEISEFQKILKNYRLNYLVVDSYQATAGYLAALEEIQPVCYIDDLKREAYDVSVVIHYISPYKSSSYEEMYKNTHIQLLNDMKYAPLRPEFHYKKEKVIRQKSILITTGGTDFFNVAGKVAALCQNSMQIKSYKIHLIIGSMNQHETELEQLAEKYTNIILHKNITNMSDYMRLCEVAVSAGGTTLLELCACKIPTVCFSFADNQVKFANDMGKIGAVKYVGDVRKIEDIENKIVKQLLIFIKNEEERKKYADCMGKLIDGHGTERIADVLC